ncbi:MAG: CoA pyrophosphatase [Acidobacteriota bacterium]|nr:CoA pyrophosphatase [Acidobacteriota bacterium]
MLHLDDIRLALAGHEPTLVDPSRDPFAAVALILAGRVEDPEVLFIERARREGDPWSGQMAFPGGRYEPEDGNLRVTAERETSEEVGVDLTGAEVLGRLDDQEGRRGMFIAGWAYYLREIQAMTLSDEVEEAMWVPTSIVLDPASRVGYDVEYASTTFPGIRVGHPQRHIVWGLTFRFLETFLEAVGFEGTLRS